MDIAAFSVLKNLAQLKMDVSVSLMKKVVETAEQNSGLVNQMLDKAAKGKVVVQAKLPHIGNNVDRFV